MNDAYGREINGSLPMRYRGSDHGSDITAQKQVIVNVINFYPCIRQSHTQMTNISHFAPHTTSQCSVTMPLSSEACYYDGMMDALNSEKD